MCVRSSDHVVMLTGMFVPFSGSRSSVVSRVKLETPVVIEYKFTLIMKVIMN